MKPNIFFDLDSTLVTIEGLDHLALKKDVADEVVPITNAAMNGEISMQVAMEKKINLLRPSRQDIIEIGQTYLQNFTCGAQMTVKTLQELGFNCWILTGNFMEAATLVGRHLNIPENQVIANQIEYSVLGEFEHFNSAFPLAGNNGKTTILKQIGIDLAHTVMVGDGNTDLETQPHIGLFIGFGGVVRRPKVAAQAKVYVDHPDLRTIIPYILNWQTIRP